MLASTSDHANGIGLLRGQLVILLHRQLRVRRRLEVELVGRGYSVLPLDTERDLVAYLDGARTYDARVAYPDAVVAEELSIGVSGLLRIAAMQDEISGLPVVLLTERPLTIDDGFRKRLGVARILCRPYTPDDVAAAVEAILPPAYSDESGGRS